MHCIGLYAQLGGMKYFERHSGSFNKTSFREWFARMLTAVGETVPLSLNNLIVVIDNTPCHSGVKKDYIAEHYPNFAGVQILRLGPYSPALSPIEMFWSSFKSNAKRRLADRARQLQRPDLRGT